MPPEFVAAKRIYEEAAAKLRKAAEGIEDPEARLYLSELADVQQESADAQDRIAAVMAAEG